MAVREKLTAVGQEHVFKFFDQLSEVEQQQLTQDVTSLPLDELESMFKAANNYKAPTAEGLKAVSADRTGKAEDDKGEWFEAGLSLVRQSKLAVVLLAGGQGTRLGVDYPKGMYNIGLPSCKSLFQVQCERLRRVEMLAGAGKIYLYIMTSGPTRAKTEAFFKANNYFGLASDQVGFFNQGTLPCFDFSGKVMMSSKSSVARAPDGNGGIYAGLKNEGVLEKLKADGVEACHFYCVDNSLVKVADPTFVGFCHSLNADCGNKSVVKTEPTESVGVVLQNAEGVHQVVEYSELSDEMAHRRDGDGQLTFRAGNICNHFFTVEFLDKVCSMQLPYHIAKKKIPTLDEAGNLVKPDTPNGIKLEKFIFDVFAFSKNFALLEVDRKDEFSPLKNSDKAPRVDCPAACRWDVMNMNHRHLAAVGAKIVQDGVEVCVPSRPSGGYPSAYPVVIEISSLRTYKGENLDEFAGKTLSAPVIII